MGKIGSLSGVKFYYAVDVEPADARVVARLTDHLEAAVRLREYGDPVRELDPAPGPLGVLHAALQAGRDAKESVRLVHAANLGWRRRGGWQLADTAAPVWLRSAAPDVS